MRGPAKPVAFLFWLRSPARRPRRRPAYPCPGPHEPVRRDPLGTRLINVPTPYHARQPADRGALHPPLPADGAGRRRAQPVGLDSGADVGIGLAWGVTSRLDVALFRSSFQENFEARPNTWSWSSRRAFRSPSACGPGRTCSGAKEWRTRTGRSPSSCSPAVSHPGSPPALPLLGARHAAPARRLQRTGRAHLPAAGKSLIELELIPANRDLDESVDAWHVALSRDLGGHIFEILIGNSRATTVDQIPGRRLRGRLRDRRRPPRLQPDPRLRLLRRRRFS